MSRGFLNMAGGDRPSVRGRGRWVARATWAYAALVLAALAMIRWRGDWWWPPTILLFGPRWPFLAPVAGLAFAAWWRRRRDLWASQAAIALLVLGPLMVFSAPIGRLWGSTPRGPRFRIMTFNRAQVPIDAEGLIRLIEDEKISLICFQEGGTKPDFVMDDYFAEGWYRDERGTIFSRFPVVEEWDPRDHFGGSYKYLIGRFARVRVRTPEGDEFVVASVHLPTMRPGFEHLRKGDLDGFRSQIAWRDRQTSLLKALLDEVSGWPIVVGGDLNTPADSPMLDPLHAQYSFAFERAGWGYGYTRPTELPWTRIDHLLAGPGWEFTRCRVGPDLGSDHLPVIAEVVLTRGRR